MRLLVLSDIHAGRGNQSRSLVPSDDKQEQSLDDERIEGTIRLARELRPDAIVCPGDLTQEAKIVQFRASLAYLARLGSEVGLNPASHVVVPGNHDTDWDAVRRFPEGSEEAQLRSLSRFAPAAHASQLPDIHTKFSPRILQDPFFDVLETNGAKFLMVNTAAHDGPHMKVHHGAVSNDTIAKIREHDAWNTDDAKLRIAVIHHHLMSFVPGPPHFGSDASALQNADALIRAFEDIQIDFVIHGHQHAPRIAATTTGRARIPTLGCGTYGGLPSLADSSITQVFHIVDIDRCSSTEQLACSARGTIRTYGWVRGEGWRLAESPWIAPQDHFGHYEEPRKIEQNILSMITSGETMIRQSELRARSEMLRWLHSRDLRDAMENVAGKDFTFMKDPRTLEFALVRA